MKLYHGTRESKLATVLQHGITPRGGKRSNWKFASRPDMVYLSTAYAFYFGLATKGRGRVAVLEIDADKLDTGLLYPDEDFLSQVAARKFDAEVDDVHFHYRKRLGEYQKNWQKSIDHLGTCGYRGVVPVGAITRICLFHRRGRPQVSMMMADPTITLINYKLFKGKYTGLVAWMFGDRPDIPVEDYVRQKLPQQAERWAKESQDRTGIEVLTPGELAERMKCTTAERKRRTVVRKSALHGRGLFAVGSFSAGEAVEDIEGEIVHRDSRGKYTIKLPGKRTLILTNKTKLINHASDPNVVFDAKKWKVVAIRDIADGEELTSEYASFFDP